MAKQIFTYIVHKQGKLDDSALELIAAAKAIDSSASVTAVVVGSGIDALCKEAAATYKEVWKIDDKSFSYPNAEAIRSVLVKIIPKGSIILVPHNTFGMDLSPGLSVKLDAAFVSDTVGFGGVQGNDLKIIRQEYGGMAHTHVLCDISAGAVINIRPGAFKPDESKSAGGSVTDKTGEAKGDTLRRRFLEVVEAEVGDIDITKSEVLVSVGRGIEDQENLGIIRDLAAAVGGEVSCSRPIVDAKWLEKARQVGTSGQTVKPKVYMALGISGSFQHMGGIKGNPFIVAVNKNPKAPIFQFAEVGVVANLLEFIPELTEKIKEMKG